MKARTILFVLTAFGLGIALASFLPSPGALVSNWVVSREELARVSSPDGLVDAVVIRTNAGATTSYGHEVYLVPSGKQAPQNREYAVFLADQVDDLKVRWAKVGLLEVNYREARIFSFSNFWQSNDVENFQYIVRIRESPSEPLAAQLP